MKNTTSYSKNTFFGFISFVILCALVLLAIRLSINEQVNAEKQSQRDFVEVVTTLAEQIIGTPDLPEVPSEAPEEAMASFQYIEVTGGCGIHFADSECLNVRSGPSKEFPVVTSLRNGIVLKVDGLIENEHGQWYKIVFDEWLRYPNRVAKEWYVSADHVRLFTNKGIVTLDASIIATTSKRILIDRSQQILTAYEGDEIFMQTNISTGLDLSPTPRGSFTIFRKTPTRYMQGPIPDIPGSDYYDLPGVPWNLYFTEQGAVIHGAYWHDSFGKQYSHGCVNLLTADAQTLYHWADIGTIVIVRD